MTATYHMPLIKFLMEMFCLVIWKEVPCENKELINTELLN